jgi:glucose-6-phosphate 1-dehydrogenase
MMMPPEPVVVLIFGASGDLTQHKIVPAFYNLFLEKGLPETFALVGFSRTPFSDASLCKDLRQGVDQFSRRGKSSDEDWQDFSAHIIYIKGGYNDSAAYAALADRLSKLGKGHHHLFSLSTPPEEFKVITQQLGKANLSHDPKRVTG